ncbi:MAG: prephenate dehydratase [Pseudomonadota bacterium]
MNPDDETNRQTLASLRDQIDALDGQVLELINQRARLAQAVGHLKNGIIYKPEREAQVVARLQGANPGPLPADSVAVVFKEIMSACRALEQQLTIAYLGPEGTFSEAAAIKHFGHAVKGLPCASIDEVFRQVERGDAHYGVAPIENSTEGAVTRTFDLLLGTRLLICGEVYVRVRQNLLRRVDGLDDIRTVYSHPQSLAQCQGWLRAHLPTAELVPVASNSEAARMAALADDAAAIAGERAAEHHNLVLAARGIEDTPHNTTRFVVLSRESVARSGRDRTSLALSISNQPGALVELLQPFARHGINLISWNTRPARDEMWEYVFCVDVEGHVEDAPLQAALKELGEKAAFVKVLGSYPRV